ncbi:hypothetical protein BHE74_00035171, partial [Ensete ventricosum]
PVYLYSLPFRILSHAFVIRFSSAATSLVLFLSLPPSSSRLTRSSSSAVPSQSSTSSPACHLGSRCCLFLVAFTCNIYLQTYGGQRSETKKDLIILLVFPTVCCLFLFYRGSYFLPSFGSLWR